MQAIAHNLIEWVAYFYLLFFLRDAIRRGHTWVATLFWGIVVGFFLECAIIKTQNVEQLHYTYTMDHVAGWADVLGLFGVEHVADWLNVPLWLGIGWGIVFYGATWVAHQWPHPLSLRWLVAGALAVNIDFALDPVAHLIKLWVWHWEGESAAHTFRYCDVPFDNYVAWFGIVAAYTFWASAGFRIVNTSKPPWRGWLTLVVPLVAAAVSVLGFFLLRAPVNKFYLWIGASDRGQLAVFIGLFLMSLLALLLALPAARRDLEPNWTVLSIPIVFHSLCLFLFVSSGDTAKQPSLFIIIPLAGIMGFFAYSWPVIETILPHEKWRMSARAPRLLAAADTPFDLNAEQNLYPERLAPDYRPVSALPPQRFRRERLRTYSGQEVLVTTFRPVDERELREVLKLARQHGWRVTFRAAGHSFDSQALPDDLCVILDGFRSIEVNRQAATVTVGPSARWGEILSKTLEHQLLPYVMVTSKEVTAGGTISANGLSRFSATLGREGEHVASFRIMLPDGTPEVCDSRHPLFQAVIGGLGYVGAVTEITYRLMPLPPEWKGVVVETQFEVFHGLRDLAQHLVPKARACAHAGQSDSVENAGAVSATLYLRGRDRGLLARSKYVAPRALRPSVFHSPESFRHRALQVAALFPLLRRLGYWLTFQKGKSFDEPFYDAIEGYTFFEDGNVWLKRIARQLRFGISVRQQSYFLPASIDDAGVAQERLGGFLSEADRRLDGYRLVPALIDVLYLPRDLERIAAGARAPGFFLSASRHTAGFMVTFTFEKFLSPRFDVEETFLVEMADVCAADGGRVHLVKSVRARPGVVRAMYEADFADMRAAASPLLFNEFSDRVGLSEPRLEVL